MVIGSSRKSKVFLKQKKADCFRHRHLRAWFLGLSLMTVTSWASSVTPGPKQDLEGQTVVAEGSFSQSLERTEPCDGPSPELGRPRATAAGIAAYNSAFYEIQKLCGSQFYTTIKVVSARYYPFVDLKLIGYSACMAEVTAHCYRMASKAE